MVFIAFIFKKQIITSDDSTYYLEIVFIKKRRDYFPILASFFIEKKRPWISVRDFHPIKKYERRN